VKICLYEYSVCEKIMSELVKKLLTYTLFPLFIDKSKVLCDFWQSQKTCIILYLSKTLLTYIFINLETFLIFSNHSIFDSSIIECKFWLARKLFYYFYFSISHLQSIFINLKYCLLFSNNSILIVL
jgi:hypothetical protein